MHEEFAPKTVGYIDTLREKLPALFPGTTFSFLPADITSQILNFGLPAPIDVQVIGNKTRRTGNTRRRSSDKIKTIPGIADRPHPAGVRLPRRST